MSIFYKWLSCSLIVIASLLTGCGGDGGSGVSFDIPPEPSGVTLSGKVTPAALILFDSDTNDPNSSFETNNTFADAQEINNYATINGFASYEGTSVQKQKAGVVDDLPNDGRFETTADEADIFLVPLAVGQVIQLEVIDYINENPASFQYVGDLDLVLFNEAKEIVDGSYNQGAEGAVEEVEVPESGVYYVQVLAQSGVSKYVLRIDNKRSVLRAGSNKSFDFKPNQAIIKYKPQSVQASSFEAPAIPEEFTVSHHDRGRATLATFQTNNLRVFSAGGGSETNSTFWNELAAINWDSYQKLLTLKAIKQLDARDDIEYAEPNYKVYAKKIPNDPHYWQQWHYRAMHLPQAWDVTTGTGETEDVIVAVIDTGVFIDHEDLQGKLVYGYDFLSGDSNPDDPGDAGTIRDSSWHGTHVAATIAANSNNNVGASGVSWGAKIMPLRVLGVDGGTDYDVNQAIRYAAGLSTDSGVTLPTGVRADVINLSLGGEGDSQSGQDAINDARKENVIIVAASGNSGTSLMEYPASYDGVISVGAVNYDGDIAPYSTFNSAVDIVAPGGNLAEDLNRDGNPDGVLSATVTSMAGLRSSSYGYMHGTSMATPHVSGVLALMKAIYPDLTPLQVDALISNGLITELPAGGRNDFYGYGSLNALKAVEEASRLAAGGQTPDLPPIYATEPTSLSLGNLRTATFELKNLGGPSSEQVSAVETDAVWISVAPTDVDENGFGFYQVTIDDGELSESPYSGEIQIMIGTDSAVILPVSMQVGNQTYESEFAVQYVTLLGMDGKPVRPSVRPVFRQGNYDYSFSNVEEGFYYIVSGSDVDNDEKIDTRGESFGAYPVTNSPKLIEVKNSDISKLDFVVDIRSLSDASSNGFDQLNRISR